MLSKVFMLCLCFGLTFSVGLAYAQTEYDEPVVQEGDQVLLTAALANTEDNVFALLPNLENVALLQTLQQLAATKTVYLVIPEAARGNLARSLVAAGVKVKTLPTAPAEGLLIIDYRVTIDGPLLGGQGTARLVDNGSTNLYLVYQASLGWQGATPY